MSHIVESCPLTKLNGVLSRLHSDAVSWLTNYGSWQAYEKKKINTTAMQPSSREVHDVKAIFHFFTSPVLTLNSFKTEFLLTRLKQLTTIHNLCLSTIHAQPRLYFCQIPCFLWSYFWLSTSCCSHIFCELCYVFHISIRLDSCNRLLAGVSSQLLQRLQVIQNAAARLVTGARRSEHMMLVLRDLHWLPVRQRITFKTAVLVYKCLHDMAPQYLQTHCEPTSTVTSRRLWSAHSGRLTVPCTRTNYSDCSFAVQGASLSKDLLCGTVFLLNFVHQTSRWQRSETDLRHSCSTYL